MGGFWMKWKPKIDNGHFPSSQTAVAHSGSARSPAEPWQQLIYGLFGCHDDDNQIKKNGGPYHLANPLC